MVYRLSRIAGVATLLYAFYRLNGLLRPTAEGTPWQFVVIAGFALGATITVTALVYRLNPVALVLLNLAGMAITIARIAAPATTKAFLPTSPTWSAVTGQLDQALAVIRTGIEPVLPLPGIVIIVALVFWVAGILMTWGLMTGHPYVALVPPMVLSLQFATMDRSRTDWLETTVFLALIAASIVAITTDERVGVSGRMARQGQWPSWRNRLAPSAAALMGVTLAAAVLATGAVRNVVPYDGIVPWRTASGLASDFYGGIAYNPFIGIRQSLVSQSTEPVFLARITGDLPAGEVYFRLLTMETYNGGQFFADRPVVTTLEDRPWEVVGNLFTGPTALVTTEIQIERLRMDWLPEAYMPESFQGDDDLERDVRVRRLDGALRIDGGLSYQGLAYTVESRIPQPDISVLATGADGKLSPVFALAAESQENVPEPTVVAERPEPPDVEKYLQLPDEIDRRIGALAEEQTRNLETNFEIGVALESWFRSNAFDYTTDIDPGYAASSLSAWLLDPASPNYRTGYCENFATSMAVMARFLGVPSRVVLGFTPGEPTGEENVVVVRDRNAHAWVELWIPTQGWVRFDPTPRRDGINPTTFEAAETELGFSLTSYLDVPDPEPLDSPSSVLPRPRFADDNNVPGFIGLGGAGDSTGGGFAIPGWLKSSAPWLFVALVLFGGLPALKLWRRKRRMKRLLAGDITAAWEDIVARLDDLGDHPAPSLTPAELAESVDEAMAPLATVYARAIYGPAGAVDPRHIETARRSLDETTARLSTRYTARRRFVAWYRPTSVVPDRFRRNHKDRNGRSGG